jgi:hypothetical protein
VTISLKDQAITGRNSWINMVLNKNSTKRMMWLVRKGKSKKCPSQTFQWRHRVCSPNMSVATCRGEVIEHFDKDNEDVKVHTGEFSKKKCFQKHFLLTAIL